MSESVSIFFKGISEPRRSTTGKILPSARAISVSLFEEVDRPSHVHTLMMTNYGQFTDHDMTRTAVKKLSTDAEGVYCLNTKITYLFMTVYFDMEIS